MIINILLLVSYQTVHSRDEEDVLARQEKMGIMDDEEIRKSIETIDEEEEDEKKQKKGIKKKQKIKKKKKKRKKLIKNEL